LLLLLMLLTAECAFILSVNVGTLLVTCGGATLWQLLSSDKCAATHHDDHGLS
jgi:hypothetical protein